jgi:hypothetical protein
METVKFGIQNVIIIYLNAESNHNTKLSTKCFKSVGMIQQTILIEFVLLCSDKLIVIRNKCGKEQKVLNNPML